MPLYEITSEGLAPHGPMKFAELGLKERDDLQRLLRDDIAVIDPDLMVVAEEFGNWQDAKRRIDLLAIDRTGHLVVIELKRTDDGGHMELQAIRYAAMVSAMTFDDVVTAFTAHLKAHRSGEAVDARSELLDFLDTAEGDEDPLIPTEVRIVLVSADFGREITTTVLWLNGLDGMDIRCVRLVPYSVDSKTLIDIRQVIPLPEAADFQVQLRRKAVAEERARTGGDGRDFTKFAVEIDGQAGPPLAKRQAIRSMLLALHARGADLAKAQAVLTRPRGLQELDGLLAPGEASIAALAAAHPGIDTTRWFTDDPMHDADRGTTWLLSRMWGRDSEETLTALANEFPALGVSYQAVGR